MIQITSGQFKGRKLRAPDDPRVRPTLSKIRMAMMNSLVRDIPGACVLDLFAGSGALGLEALSHGAERVVFVEKDRTALKCLESNIKTLNVDQKTSVIVTELKSSGELASRVMALGPFDVVFADPPYQKGWAEFLLHAPFWTELLSEGGVFCFEQSDREEEVEGELPALVKVKSKTYGDTRVVYFQKKGSAE